MIGIHDNVEFVVRPLKGTPTQSQWESFIVNTAEQLRLSDFDVVFIDTWQSDSPVWDENAAAGTMRALNPLPMLFVNLRSMREAEFAEDFPMHVVCEWIGINMAVAKKHYLQTTDEHYECALQ